MKKIHLPNIGKIEIFHKKQSKLYITTLAFIQNYIPSIKYYNDNLLFERKIQPETLTPIINIYDLQLKQIEKVDSASILHHTYLLKRVLEINNAINPENKAYIMNVGSGEIEDIVLKQIEKD